MEQTHAPRSAVAVALISALLFAASTPATKTLLTDVQPVLLAGLLYLGSGLGLGAINFANRTWRKKNAAEHEASLTGKDVPLLAVAILFGGIIAPVALLLGLNHMGASTASLLLNLETVFTALIAWFIFHENVDRRSALALIAIVSGGIVLCTNNSWSFDFQFSFSGLYVAGACLCWAIDNNITRKIANANPAQIASIKGVVAGLCNCSLALLAGAQLPSLSTILTASLVGLIGYGLSLMCFIRSMRDLGAARAVAYFSVAPFLGAALSVFFLHEPLLLQTVVCGMLMALGVGLQLSEDHAHLHEHRFLEHEHMHVHDSHHQHEHAASLDTKEPHSHFHKHEPMVHSHPHFPDMHHDHEH